MARQRVAMHRLEELVRLHRMGTGPHEVARLLRMGASQERKYRRALEGAGLLAGSPDELPPLEVPKAAVGEALPRRVGVQQTSSVEPWAAESGAMLELEEEAGPQAIDDRLKLQVPEFMGSVDAVKRLCRRLTREKPVRAQDGRCAGPLGALRNGPAPPRARIRALPGLPGA